MPIRPREITDQITEARMREVIRHLLNQEVNNLLGDIEDNTEGVADNLLSIMNIERRSAARNNTGLFTSTSLATSTAHVVTEVPFAATQVWSRQIPTQPIQVTLWSRTMFSADAAFDTFTFDAVQFDEAEEVVGVNRTAAVTYKPGSTMFSIDWGLAKTGTLYDINLGSDATAIVAVAD